ncbi:neuromedin-B [Arapaima gigas]
MLFYFPLATSARVDLTELRNQVSKIKVNPRGNLWATGHFMGKKNVVDGSLLGSANQPAFGGIRSPASTQLFREMFKLTVRDQQRDVRDGAKSNELETDLVMKGLRSVAWDRRK